MNRSRSGLKNVIICNILVCANDKCEWTLLRNRLKFVIRETWEPIPPLPVSFVCLVRWDRGRVTGTSSHHCNFFFISHLPAAACDLANRGRKSPTCVAILPFFFAILYVCDWEKFRNHAVIRRIGSKLPRFPRISHLGAFLSVLWLFSKKKLNFPGFGTISHDITLNLYFHSIT